MNTAFLILLFLAVLHFIYEGIIAPSIRLNLRYKLFSIRDDLRRLRIVHGENIEKELFHNLQSSINNAISLLNRVDLILMVKVHMALEKDKALSEDLKKRMKLLDNCPIEEVKEAKAATNRIVGYALLANTGMWVLYLLPIAIICSFIEKLTNSLKLLIREIICMPESKITRIAPPEEAMV